MCVKGARSRPIRTAWAKELHEKEGGKGEERWKMERRRGGVEEGGRGEEGLKREGETRRGERGRERRGGVK